MLFFKVLPWLLNPVVVLPHQENVVSMFYPTHFHFFSNYEPVDHMSSYVIICHHVSSCIIPHEKSQIYPSLRSPRNDMHHLWDSGQACSLRKACTTCPVSHRCPVAPQCRILPQQSHNCLQNEFDFVWTSSILSSYLIISNSPEFFTIRFG